MNQEADQFIGKQFGQGKFEIISVIGHGGMATVYQARQASVNRVIALKIMPPSLQHDAVFFQRFKREVDIIAHLEHPHIVPIYDHGENEGDGALYIAMRYVAGGSLTRLIHQGKMSVDMLKKPLMQIGEALAFAHQQGFIHRDLKPDNILLDEYGNGYLSDFGIAHLAGSQLTGNMIVGTPAYLSPEQASGAGIDHCADIYAFGIVLFECLTGRLPFVADTPLGMIMQHVNEPMPSVRQYRADVPPALEAVVMKATAKRPADRYATVEDMMRAFQAAISAAPSYSLNDPTIVEKSPRVQDKQNKQDRQDKQDKKKGNLTSDQRNRERMLEKVSVYWVKGILENSLHGTAMLELGLKEKPDAVERPWDVILQQPNMPDQLLPVGTHIRDVYDETGGELLILGDPGSGKTTTLLELARDLIARAQTDETMPMPTVFNLSSWTNERKPIHDWLISELNAKYQIPKKVSESWIKADQILPLLDGLDEVEATYREACVEAINKWRQDHGLLPVVVCSRIADYELLTTKLRLQNAVVLQPLTQAQVEEYLDSAGKAELASVRAVLDDDEKLRRLVTSPLMLSIVTLAYWDKPLEEIPQFDTLEGRREHLFDTYVERMLTRRGMDSRYTRDKTEHWLSVLAKQMSKQGQSVFYLELIQPYWLEKWQHRLLMLVMPMNFGYAANDEKFVVLLIVLLMSGVLAAIREIKWLAALYVPVLFFLGTQLFPSLLNSRFLIRSVTDRFRFRPFKTRLSFGEKLRLRWKRVAALTILNGAFALFLCPSPSVAQSMQLLGVMFIFLWLQLFIIMVVGAITFYPSVDVEPMTTSPGDALMRLSAWDRHIYNALRFALWRTGQTPFNYEKFLDYAANRVLLRKVGGGYVFIHRLLLEHFAAKAVQKPKRCSTQPDRTVDVQAQDMVLAKHKLSNETDDTIIGLDLETQKHMNNVRTSDS